jgi:hypothetical protein
MGGAILQHSNRLLKLIFISAMGALQVSAVSPVVAYAISNVTVATDWTGGGAAAHWANSCAGAAGSSGASGGAGVPIWGVTSTLPAGVPGAAGLGDALVICTGVTVRVSLGVGLELNKGISYPDTADGFTVRATDATTFGRFIVDNGGLVKLHGASASGFNFGVVNQFADFHVMPGGSIWIGGFANIPTLSISGRGYFGCSDQTKYPMLDCAGNAGGWVTASVAATLNFSGTLPVGLAAKQLVEISPLPQAPSYPYPYTAIDGVTRPSAPPVLPTTSDTGAGKTCGTLATCRVPFDSLLCVVAVSGSTVSLGWPAGGNSWTPYCTGTETALAITAAGSGQLWLKQPAFVWRDPSVWAWNVAKTFNPVNSASQMDPVVATMVFGNEPVSNAAGTGPGRPGDNSLVLPAFLTPFTGTPSCTKLDIQSVTAGTCFLDYLRGQMAYGVFVGGSGFTTATPVTWTGATAGSNTVAIDGPVFQVPAGVRGYNEMVFENVDFQGIFNGAGQYAAAIKLGTLANTVNNHMAVRYSSTRLTNALIGLYDFTASAVNPVEVTFNSFTSIASNSGSFGMDSVIMGSPQYWDLSNNFSWSSAGFTSCPQVASGAFADIAFGAVTNNVIVGETVIGGDQSSTCQWRGLRVQDNQITQSGTQIATGGGNNYPGFSYGMISNFNHPEAPNVFSYNMSYGGYRGFTLSSNQVWDHQFQGPCWHHCMVISSPDDQVAGEMHNTRVQNSLILGQVECADLGYLNFMLIQGLTYRNNTCIVGPNSNSFAGVVLGDVDPTSIQLLAGLNIYNNAFAIVAGRPVLAKQPDTNTPHMQRIAFGYTGYNSSQSSSTAMYAGVAGGNPNSLPNPSYNRNIAVSQGGADYNSSTTRSVTGVTLQNTSYSTAQANVAMKYTYASSSNRTVQFSIDGGSTYGAAAQLNWGGAGTVYTIAAAGVTDPGVTHEYLQVTVTGTPFSTYPNLSGSNPGTNPANAPSALWALMLTGANTGQVYATFPAQGAAASTGILFFTPRVTGIAATDTFILLQGEVRAFAPDATNYVDVGVLGTIQSLPSSTQTDTGISFVNTDYCGSAATPCPTGPVISGLPSTFTTGGPATPMYAIPLPIAGGSAEAAFCIGQALCGGTSYYQPTAGAWRTSGSKGMFVGAVPPIPATPTGILP